MTSIKFAPAILLAAVLALSSGCATHTRHSSGYIANSGAPSDSGLSGSERGQAGSVGVRDYAEVLADPGPF